MHFAQQQALLAGIQLVFQHSMLSAETNIIRTSFQVYFDFFYTKATNYVGYKHTRTFVIDAF